MSPSNTRLASVDDVDALAQEIRRVDGDHSLGAAALAEALMPFVVSMKARATLPSRCIGCGCDDLHACMHPNGEACSWLAVDRQEGRGVCSMCRKHLARWNAGDHAFAASANVRARNQARP